MPILKDFRNCVASLGDGKQINSLNLYLRAINADGTELIPVMRYVSELNKLSNVHGRIVLEKKVPLGENLTFLTVGS